MLCVRSVEPKPGTLLFFFGLVYFCLRVCVCTCLQRYHRERDREWLPFFSIASPLAAIICRQIVVTFSNLLFFFCCCYGSEGCWKDFSVPCCWLVCDSYTPLRKKKRKKRVKKNKNSSYKPFCRIEAIAFLFFFICARHGTCHRVMTASRCSYVV